MSTRLGSNPPTGSFPAIAAPLTRSSVVDAFSDPQSLAESRFDARNHAHQLRSRCNQLEYQMTKNRIAHETQVAAFMLRNQQLEAEVEGLQKQGEGVACQREELREVLAEVRQQNHTLSKQIQSMRIELSTLEQRALTQTEESVRQSQGREREISKERQERIRKLEEEVVGQQTKNHSLKMQLEHAKAEFVEKEKVEREIRGKDRIIEQYKRREEQLASEMQSERLAWRSRQSALLQQHRNEVTALQRQLQICEDSLQASQSKQAEMGLELGRCRSQVKGLEQYKEYIENCNIQNQENCRKLQEDVYRAEQEAANARKELYQSKLQARKQMTQLSMQLEEQRVNHSQKDSRYQQELLKIRSASVSPSCRQSSEETELREQVNQLKHTIERLQSQLDALQSKYNKKTEKMNSLEIELRKKFEGQVSSLEGQVYRLLNQNEQLLAKVESEGVKKVDSSQRDALLAANEQREVLCVELRKSKEKIERQERRITDLQLQIEEASRRPTVSAMPYYDAQERLRTIEALEEEVRRLSHQLSQSRGREASKGRQLVASEQEKTIVILNMEQELTQLKNMKAKLQDEFQQKLIEIQKNRERQDSMKQQIQQQGHRFEQLKKELSKIKEEKENDNVELKATKQQLILEIQDGKSLSAELQKCQSQLVASKAEATQARLQKQASIRANTKTTEQLRSSILKLENEIYSLKEEYSNSLSDTNQVLQKYHQLQDDHRKIRLKCSLLESEVDEARAATLKYEKCLQENRLFRNNLKIKQEEIGKLSSFLSNRASEHQHRSQTPHSQKKDKKESTFHPRKGVKLDLWLSRLA